MNYQPHVTLVNGTETSAIDISDRGLAYGDGLFETMRVVDGEIPLLQYHLARFEQGLHKLMFDDVEEISSQFQRYVNSVLKQLHGMALIKVIVTRGSGGRGYLIPDIVQPTFIAQAFDLPTFPTNYTKQGVQARICRHRLSPNPAFAGLKHLNRLDQVLASEELSASDVEGVMLDLDDRIIEGIKSNILIFANKKIFTPKLSECGVRGTLRDYLITNLNKIDLDIEEKDIQLDDLLSAKGIAFINSIFGLWPLHKLDNKAFQIARDCERIQAFLSAELGYNLPS